MKKHTKEQLIEELQYFAEYLGRTPTIKDVRQDELVPGITPYTREFGTWNTALTAAGLNLNKLAKAPDKCFMIKKLRALAQLLGRSPLIREVNKEDSMSHGDTYCKVFGSWNKALIAANLKVTVEYNKDPLVLIKKLKVFSEELERTPKRLEVSKNPNMCSPSTYDEYFGSWNNAIIKAGLKPNCSQSHITEENLALSYNKEWLKEQNQTKTLYEISSELGFNKHAMSGRFKELDIKPNYTLTSSIKEIEWLDSLGIKERQYPIANYRVDGYDPETNTVYEFLGDYWHGNPEVYDPDDYNEKVGKTFRQLHDETMERLKHIKSLGYNILIQWENGYGKEF